MPDPVEGRNLLWRRLLVSAIAAGPGYHRGAYDTQPVALGAAWNLFELMAGSAEHFEKDLADIPAADAKIKNSNETALAGQDANDVIYEFAASKDYDPLGSLAKIKAPLVAVNFADDALNPAELGVLDTAIKKVAGARAVPIPAGPKSRGHQALRAAKLWAARLRPLQPRSTAPAAACPWSSTP